MPKSIKVINNYAIKLTFYDQESFDLFVKNKLEGSRFDFWYYPDELTLTIRLD